MARPPSLIARTFEPLIDALWVLLLVWSVVVAVVWMGGEGLIARVSDAALGEALTIVARDSDLIWLILATIDLYLHLVERLGLARARIAGTMLLAVPGIVAVCNARTGFPLGALLYTGRLGPRLGSVPLGWLLLWVVIVIGGRALAEKVFPRASHHTLCWLTGALAALTDFNLEPIAIKVRLYWFWYDPATHLPAAPLWRNFLSWFLAAAALAWLLRDEKVVTSGRDSWRAAGIFLIFNLLLLAGHLRMLTGG